MVKGKFAAASLVAATAWSALSPSGIWPVEARACGLVGNATPVELPPSLAHEEVVLIHDAETRLEHLIRKVVFRGSKERFGFVVPTPSRPVVAKVPVDPFPGLDRQLPFTGTESFGWGLGLGLGGAGGPGDAKVTVVSAQKVGSFTAFVLVATDEDALTQWLSKNGLVKSPELERWLAHYVTMKFHFVALRYDPDLTSKSVALRAETVRISFESPLPYYPYLEPSQAGEIPAPTRENARVLDVWLVTKEPMVPIAARKVGDHVEYVRPLRAGHRYTSTRSQLLKAFGVSIEGFLPTGDPSVQTFQDQKRSREGIGDILFAPMQPTDLRDDQLEPVLGILDPALMPKREAP